MKLQPLLYGFLLALAGALLARALHIPLPWLIGPLLANATVRLSGGHVTSHPRLRRVGQWILGTSIGTFFTPTVVEQIGSNLVPIAISGLYALVLGALGTWVMYRVAKLDLRTAWFASAIGGAAEMSSLADRHGARTDVVATSHSLRILTVVVTVPFVFRQWGVTGLDASTITTLAVNPTQLLLLLTLTAAGGLLMRRLRLPNPWILGTMATAALLSWQELVLTGVPNTLLNTAQLLIGWTIGSRYEREFLRSAPKLMVICVLITLAGIALTFGLGLLLADYTTLPAPSLILGMTPGGIAEMAITATVLQLGAPMVATMQTLRMAVVTLTVWPLYRWLNAWLRVSRP